MIAQVPVPEGAVLTVWVIYERPADHPDSYVLRPQFTMNDNTIRASTVAWKAPDPDTLRAILPPGLVKLLPQPGENPVILETWI